jgi:hypothetical protein
VRSGNDKRRTSDDASARSMKFEWPRSKRKRKSDDNNESKRDGKSKLVTCLRSRFTARVVLLPETVRRDFLN